MKSLLRHAVLILATGCFLAMASGLVLCLHLAHHEDPLHHGSEHCCLCQQLLVAMKDFAAGIEPAHVETDTIRQVVEARLDAPLPQTVTLNLGARAPPA